MHPSGPVKTFIYGSCVSRDTFEYLGGPFDLVRYVARQSMISAGTEASTIGAGLGVIDSPFQQRMVAGDLAGDLPAALTRAAEDLDLLLVDLVDERGGVIDVGGAYVTKLSEFWTAGGQRATRGMEQLAFGSDRHFELWSEGAGRFVQLLRSLGLVEKTLVLRTPWADRYDDGEPLQTPDWMLAPAEADALYGRYFEVLTGHGLTTVELPARLARTPRDHQWGASPFHYAPEGYEWIASRIRDFAGLEGLDLTRRDTATWGDFTDLGGIEELTACDVLPARLTVWHQGVPVDVLVEDNGSSTTLVSLGGRGRELPVFTGRAVSAGLNLNRVFVSDPGLLAAGGQAWYLGTEALDLTGLLTAMIGEIQSKLRADHLVFHGVGAGGFAALNLAHDFPGSLALVINPETHVGAEEASGLPGRDLGVVYADSFENWVICLENDRGRDQIEQHLIPWLDAVEGAENVAVLVRDWGADAKAPPSALMRRWLGDLADARGDWATVAEALGASVAPSPSDVLAQMDGAA